MDYVLYRKLFNKRDDSNFRAYHSAVPNLNLQDFDFVHGGKFQVHVPCSVGLGFKFAHYRVLSVGEEPSDLAAQLVMKKKAWSEKLKTLTPKDNERKSSLRDLKLFRDGFDQKMSLKLRRYVEHMRSDPLPGFEGDRNWLYSGSTITSIPDASAGSGLSLISCSGSGLSTISKSSIGKDGSFEEEASLSLKISEPILQVVTDPTTSLVGVRQKNNLNILKPADRDFIVALKKKVRRSNYFTSVAMRHGKVAIAKNRGKVALFDIQANQVSYATPLSDEQIPCKVRNAWNQVHWRDDELWVVKNKLINVIDPRGSVNKWDMKDALEDCENISNYFESSRDPSTCYLSTNHSLFHLDVRQRRCVHKWSHLMLDPPSFGQTIPAGEEELVILQSSDPRESVVLACGETKVQVQPWLAPAVTDGLRSAQLRGLCLDPDVSKRANYTVIGTHLFPCGDSMRQVTQNAGGDIFVRTIEESTEEGQMDVDRNGLSVEDQALWDTWSEFETKAPIQVKPFCSEIVDMTKAFDSLKIPPPKKERHQPGEAIWQLGEQFVPEILPLFKDTLVEPILDVWNIEAQEENPEEEVEVFDSDLKVTDWLMKHINSA